MTWGRLCDDLRRLWGHLGHLWHDFGRLWSDLGLLRDDLGRPMEPQGSSDTVTSVFWEDQGKPKGAPGNPQGVQGSPEDAPRKTRERQSEAQVSYGTAL